MNDPPENRPMQTARRIQRRRRFLRAVVLYAVAVMVLLGCADRLILFPSREAIYIPGAQRLQIAGPAGPLEIWTLRSRACKGQPPQAYIIEFVGNASRAEYTAEYVADEWADLPVEVWSMNYPGYGGSAGNARLKWIAPAALAAYDEMKRRAGNLPTFVCGYSIGATAALHVSAHRPVSGLVLRSPPPLRRLIIGRHGWWNLWLAAVPVALHVPSDLDSIANAQKTTAPAVFVLTGADTIVPLKYQELVVHAYAGPRRFVHMPNADHNDPIEGPAIKELDAGRHWLWTLATGEK